MCLGVVLVVSFSVAPQVGIGAVWIVVGHVEAAVDVAFFSVFCVFVVAVAWHVITSLNNH